MTAERSVPEEASPITKPSPDFQKKTVVTAQPKQFSPSATIAGSLYSDEVVVSTAVLSLPISAIKPNFVMT